MIKSLLSLRLCLALRAREGTFLSLFRSYSTIRKCHHIVANRWSCIVMNRLYRNVRYIRGREKDSANKRPNSPNAHHGVENAGHDSVCRDVIGHTMLPGNFRRQKLWAKCLGCTGVGKRKCGMRTGARRTGAGKGKCGVRTVARSTGAGKEKCGRDGGVGGRYGTVDRTRLLQYRAMLPCGDHQVW